MLKIIHFQGLFKTSYVLGFSWFFNFNCFVSGFTSFLESFEFLKENIFKKFPIQKNDRINYCKESYF